MFDVIVLGLGGMGSAAAYHLAARGKRVLGLEQYGAAHDLGSSHGSSRIIRQAYYENVAYVPLVQRAFELWEQLERDSGSELLQLTGGLMIGAADSAVVKGTIASATQHNLPYEVLEAKEIKRRYPVLAPRHEDKGVYEVKAGFLRPEACVSAHLGQAERHGAELRFGETVQAWKAERSGEGVRVATEKGSYTAANLVLAPGAWAPQLLAELQIGFDIRRHVMCWFDPGDSGRAFLPENFPIYIWDVDGHESFYGFPATDGPNGGVKAAMHSGGDRCSAATIERDISERDIRELRGYLTRFIPVLDGPLLRAATCMYTLTPDEHFVVSLHPEFKQVAVAAGFSGHGFKFTSVMGEILADLATEGTTRLPIEFFSPERFAHPPAAQRGAGSDASARA